MARKIGHPEFVDLQNIKTENYGYDDKAFRFFLTVPFKEGGQNFLYVIMKNPSVANEKNGDMTMLKVCHAAKNAGYCGVAVMNLFPYRATCAPDVYTGFYRGDTALYEKATATNKQIIKENCTGKNVVYAWGNNTICGRKDFCEVYNRMADDIVGIVGACAKKAWAAQMNKSKTHPVHALTWSYDILAKQG